MRIQLLSDLHLEFFKDASFFEDLDSKDVDVLVLAGDIGTGSILEKVLRRFCDLYPQVVYVLGNHEYYGRDRQDIRHLVSRARHTHKNLCWLDNSSCEVLGAHFVGGTMWFPKPPTSAPKWAMNDYLRIRGFERWVYKENAEFLEKVEALIQPDSIVVTHHLPSYRSVHKKFMFDPLNPFFVCDVEKTLLAKGPALWLHGHTHESLDYQQGHTRVVCNPFGYINIEENPNFDKHLILEV